MSGDLESELRELGRAIRVAPPPDDLAERVLQRLPHPRPARRSPAYRIVAAIVVALLVALAFVTPVRAAVLHWLRIGGVLIQTVPTTPATPAPATTAPLSPAPVTPGPGPTTPGLTLEQARARVSFALRVPDALGAPDLITVSDDDRVVGMDWGAGPARVHLDQFAGEFDWVFVKRTRMPVEIVAVGGRDAVWIANAHEIVYIDREGRERTETSRIAGPCLVWVLGEVGSEVTLRLEGPLTRDRAIAVAESAR